MEILEYPSEVRGVLSFDFDGTLHLPELSPPVDGAFFEVVRGLRDQGYVWGINTGRSQMQMVEGFVEGSFPFSPDFLVAREREIYTPGQFGRWVPVRDWQKKAERDQKKVFKKAKKLLLDVRAFVESETDAEWVVQVGDPAGVVATSVEEIARIVEFVEEHRGRCEMLGYLRNTIYLRFSHRDYHKGSAVQEVMRLTGVAREDVFVIGDGHNDLDKLHPDIAGMIACVGNSDEDVKAHVRGHGGYVAEGEGSLGAVEALGYFFE